MVDPGAQGEHVTYGLRFAAGMNRGLKAVSQTVSITKPGPTRSSVVADAPTAYRPLRIGRVATVSGSANATWSPTTHNMELTRRICVVRFTLPPFDAA